MGGGTGLDDGNETLSLLEIIAGVPPSNARSIGAPVIIDYLTFDHLREKLLEKAPAGANAYVLGQRYLIFGNATPTRSIL